MIFGVRLDTSFIRKARLVAYGHKVDTPPSMNYASVVLRDSVRIVIMLDALNGLDLQCDDIQNPYLNDNPKEKLFLYSGEQFIKDKGKNIIVIHALYVLKGVVFTWAEAIFQLIRDLNLHSCWKDSDAWM